MKNFHAAGFLFIAILTLTASGCMGDSESSMLSSLQQVRTFRGPAETTPTTLASLESARWVPPYPERKNPFRFPGESSVDEPRQSQSFNSASVSLIGFAKLEKPLAILKIRDQTKMLAVGETFSGIRVLEIEQPTVTLQTSNLIWSIKLFEPTNSVAAP